MRTFALQSGSSGNAIYVEAAGQRLLFDLGISTKQAHLRMQSRGRFLRDVDAIIVSHDHRDHTCGVGVCHRRFGMPIHVTRETFRASHHIFGKVARTQDFAAGDTLRFGEVSVETFPTPHDAVDGVAFVVSAEGKRLGIFTDLGSPFLDLHAALQRVDAAYLESNYDEELLWSGGYPEFLKRRIAGPAGHLSNVEAADLLGNSDLERLQWVALAHLSEHNNAPELARSAAEERLWGRVALHVASRTGPSAVLSL